MPEKRIFSKLCMILPIHNRRDTTQAFLRQIKLQSFKDVHVLVIDDGSSDGSGEMVGEELANATVLRGDGNLWWGGALQLGYNWFKTQRSQGFDSVLICNDDVLIPDDFLEQGLRLLASQERAIFQAVCFDSKTNQLLDAGVLINWSRFAFNPLLQPGTSNCLSTRGLFVRGEDFLSIGGFYPRLLPHYLSDYEFTIRAHRQGFKLCSDASLHLKVHADMTGIRSKVLLVDKKSRSYYFSKRNSQNPFYYVSFIILACPLLWILPNLLRVTKGFLQLVAESVYKGLNKRRSVRNVS